MTNSPDKTPTTEAPEPKVRDITVAGHKLVCGRLKMRELQELVYDQSGTTLDVVKKAWQAIEASLTRGGAPHPPIETLMGDCDSEDFRELYIFVLRHSKAYLTQ